ncbi:MAG TPA: hypothetical protein PKV00_05650, partial [Thauera sp.]|nr:hypothetical protein [Thauera sp.]
MSSVRRNPPKPAPSTIEGTLKLRPRATQGEAAPPPAAKTAAEKTVAEKPARKPGSARQAQDERSPRGERTQRAEERPQRSRERPP